MSFINWLKSFPMPDGKPSGKIMPGLLFFVIIELFLMISILFLFGVIK